MRSVGRRFDDPDGQEGLEPPADNDEVRGLVFDSGAAAMIVAGLVLLFAIIGAGIGIAQSEFNQSRARVAFMRGCIEYQSEDRCALLWRYGRQDLAE